MQHTTARSQGRWQRISRVVVVVALVLAVGPQETGSSRGTSAGLDPLFDCGAGCPNYDDGFRWGDEQDIGDPDECPRPSEDFLLGCIDAVVLKVLFDPRVRHDEARPAG